MDDSEVRATQAWPEGVGVALTLCILRYSCRDHKDDASLRHSAPEPSNTPTFFTCRASAQSLKSVPSS
eukprot:COSAG01_NODE_36596_length_515_cov_1.247596_2_plen_67_part_01